MLTQQMLDELTLVSIARAAQIEADFDRMFYGQSEAINPYAVAIPQEFTNAEKVPTNQGLQQLAGPGE